jgi:hypothetical protein
VFVREVVPDAWLPAGAKRRRDAFDLPRPYPPVGVARLNNLPNAPRGDQLGSLLALSGEKLTNSASEAAIVRFSTLRLEPHP